MLKNLFLIIFLKKNIKDSVFLKHLENSLNDILKKNKIKKTFLPYESQPHQHAIIKILKENNNNMNITGYLHSCLTPLPTDFFL